MLIRSAGLFAVVCLVAAQDTENVNKLRDNLQKTINDLRTEGKLSPLERNAKLDAAAQKHAENMARQDKVADDLKKPHILDGKGPKERVEDEKYVFTQYAENIAFTGPGPKGKAIGDLAVANAVNFWKGSPPHQKNMMDSGATEVGVGIGLSKSGKWYVCVVFAAPRKK
jgi:uncharacterized protein YkwD